MALMICDLLFTFSEFLTMPRFSSVTFNPIHSVQRHLVYLLILINYVCLMKKCEMNKKSTHFIHWMEDFMNTINQKYAFHEDLDKLSMLKDDQFDTRQIFYKYFAKPNNDICLVGRAFGGKRWVKGALIQSKERTTGGATEGEKYLCLDILTSDIKSGNCLVYSFGIANDWTFEKAMTLLGCQVNAFDPTTNLTEGYNFFDDTSLPMNFSKLAIHHETRNDLVIADVKPVEGLTLEDILKRSGHSERITSVLKLDVEGEEFKSLPQIFQSRVLRNIKQIHVEVHSDEVVSSWKIELQYRLSEFLSTITNSGFKLIYNAPNQLLERRLSKNRQFYSYFDIVLQNIEFET